MALTRNAVKLKWHPVKIRKNLLARRNPTKKLRVSIRRDKKVNQLYQLPSHCYRTTSPGRSSIMEEDAHPVNAQGRLTTWVNMLRRCVAAILSPQW